jgi:hypothetical protein
MVEKLLGQLTESRGANEDKFEMHITEIIRGDSPRFRSSSFLRKRRRLRRFSTKRFAILNRHMPHFVSVTYGAGSSTRDLTHDLVERIQHTTKLDPIPHLTCICHNEDEVEAILLRYARSAIGNILALGGDRPRDVPTINRAIRFNMRWIWLSSFADLMNPARIRIAAVSGSAWPVSPKDIPRRRIDWWKWITSKRKWTPAPTIVTNYFR